MSSPSRVSLTSNNDFAGTDRPRMQSLAEIVKRKSFGAVLQFARGRKEEEQVEWLDDAEKKRLMVATDGTRLTTIASICESTQLSRKEVQKMYRSFKETFPDGVVRQEEFRNVIAKLFPHGDARPYADVLFNAINDDKDEIITFKELASAIAILNKGTMREKLEWSFQIYDQDKDKLINKKELAHVLQAVYGLVGISAYPVVTGQTIKDHVTQIFEKLDTNCDGVIDISEFILNCEKDPIMKGNLLILTGAIAQSPDLSLEDIHQPIKLSPGSRFKRGSRKRTPPKPRYLGASSSASPSPPLIQNQLSLSPPPPDDSFEGFPRPPTPEVPVPVPHSVAGPEPGYVGVPAVVTSPKLLEPPTVIAPSASAAQSRSSFLAPVSSTGVSSGAHQPVSTLVPSVSVSAVSTASTPAPPKTSSMMPPDGATYKAPQSRLPTASAKTAATSVQSQLPRPQIPVKPRIPATPHGTFVPLPDSNNVGLPIFRGPEERQPPRFSVPIPIPTAPITGLLDSLTAKRTSVDKDPEKELML